MRRTAAVFAVLALAVAGCGGQDEGGSGEGSGSGSESDERKPGLSWSYDHIFDGSARLTDMAVVAEDDIWAYGDRRRADGTSDPFLLRYDGEDWREQPVQEAIGMDAPQAELTAVGSGEVWLTVPGGPTGTLGGTRIVRWDGTRWSPLDPAPSAPVGDIKAFGPDDVWTTADEGRVQHWDGTRWTVTRLPADGIGSLDGTATDDLWAVGHRDTGALDDDDLGESEYTQPVAVHWDGRTWTRTETPEYHFPEPVPPEPGASLGDVVALAEDDVRAYGIHSFNHGEVEDEPDDEAVRLRWDGERWAEQPAAPGQCAERVPVLGDGSGGLFLNGNWYLAEDGTCTKITRSRLPNEGGVRSTSRQLLWVGELARVPGSDEVVGVGYVQVNQSGNPLSKAVVVSLRR
ncbi:hypothetical protein [Streptomyces spongiae]|uniref:Exo-alpha-sialidase n=1 Tax=Streptomyces spongiae TaxID=565072 RepID=A0A5N8XF61_9ACTN|nr:hypothetical protein [Streptomyces spongiae]MPY58163.1 hypothetical protein [Streptomyces spongiae]